MLARYPELLELSNSVNGFNSQSLKFILVSVLKSHATKFLDYYTFNLQYVLNFKLLYFNVIAIVFNCLFYLNIVAECVCECECVLVTKILIYKLV